MCSVERPFLLSLFFLLVVVVETCLHWPTLSNEGRVLSLCMILRSYTLHHRNNSLFILHLFSFHLCFQLPLGVLMCEAFALISAWVMCLCDGVLFVALGFGWSACIFSLVIILSEGHRWLWKHKKSSPLTPHVSVHTNKCILDVDSSRSCPHTETSDTKD